MASEKKHRSLLTALRREKPIKNKKSRSRSKAFFLSLLIIASLITSLPLFTAPSAGAVITQANRTSNDLDWNIKSFLYYRAIGICMKYSGLQNSSNDAAIDNSRITNNNAGTGKWFATGAVTITGQKATTPTPLGLYMRNATAGDSLDVGEDGLVGCDNPALVSGAINLWGLDPVTVLCNSGFRRVDRGPEQNVPTCIEAGDSTFERRQGGNDNNYARFTEYIKSQVYGGKEPSLTKPQLYAYYLNTLNVSCIPGINTKAPGSTNYKDDNPKGYNGVKWVDIESTPEASIKTGSYIGNWEKSRVVLLGTEMNAPLNQFSKNCAQVVYDYLNPNAEAFRQWATENKESAQDQQNLNSGTGSNENASTCTVEGIGWILCPAANAAASITDALFGAVSAFMRVAPLNLSPSDNPLFTAWSVMRNIANVAFVIALLIIIFSQLTSAGITNYGVKKLLPRLIVAAILVNLSYYICAVAVDLSNIIGVATQDVFKAISIQAANTTVTDTENWQSITLAVVAGLDVALAGGIAISIASAGGLWATLAGLLPLLIGALFALIIAFLVLLARQALIIMLIVISPLAFVAYLLPNTEDLFKKWRDLFMSLLVLFPLLSVVFGASQLAGIILRESSNAAMSSGSADAGANTIAFFLYIGSFAVQAIPFFITPLLIKLSGGVLNRFAGFINNPNKGPIDRARKWADQKGKNAQNRGYLNNLGRVNGGLFGAGARRKAKLGAIDTSLDSEAKRAETTFMGKEVYGNERLRRKMAGTADSDATQRVLANAIKVNAKIEADEVEAATAVIKDPKLKATRDEVRTLASGGSVARIGDAGQSESLRAAAVKQAVETNDVKAIEDLWNQSKTWSDSMRGHFADSLQSSSNRPAYIGQGALSDLREGGAKLKDMREVVAGAIQAGAYSPDKIATADKDELHIVAEVSTNMSSNPALVPFVNTLMANANTARTDPRLSAVIGKNKENIELIVTHTKPTAPLP